MRLPRFLFNSKARHYFMLWCAERRRRIKLERQVEEWQNRLLEKVNVRPLYKPNPKPVEPAERAPIGITDKRAWVKRHEGVDNTPTVETILEAAENAQRKSA